jgi:hypothetical protein
MCPEVCKDMFILVSWGNEFLVEFWSLRGHTVELRVIDLPP